MPALDSFDCRLSYCTNKGKEQRAKDKGQIIICPYSPVPISESVLREEKLIIYNSIHKDLKTKRLKRLKRLSRRQGR
jgi:hypothetical protein